MKNILTISTIIFSSIICFSQNNIIGKWKKISEINLYKGISFDSHKALLIQRPCISKIVYEINSDGTFRLNAKNSDCDLSYIKVQEKLHSEEVWTYKGNKITIGHKKAPSVGHTYIVSVKENTMVWKGTEGQGTITFKKIN